LPVFEEFSGNSADSFREKRANGFAIRFIEKVEFFHFLVLLLGAIFVSPPKLDSYGISTESHYNNSFPNILCQFLVINII
jgi:hypothetical protein